MTSTSPLVDAEARRIIREHLASTVLVEAAAGTGKTTALVGRVVETLAAGTDVGRIAVVTFTEKAAGELKLRLRSELERRRRADATNLALEDAVLRLEEAKVTTIHAFCADLLRERPVEAGLDPAFEALGEEESEDLFARAFDDWFERVLAAPPRSIRKALRRRGDEGPVAALRIAARELARHADLDAAWTAPTWDRAEATRRVVEAAREVLARADVASSEALRDHVAKLVEVASIEGDLVAAVAEDDLEAAIVALVRPPHFFRDPPRVRGKGVAEVLDALRALDRAATSFTELADAELAALLREDLRPAVAVFQTQKAERGALDFDDLLLRTLELLRASPPARAALQRRFDRLYVDEFQDTDAVQAAILLLLAADDPSVCDPADVRVVPGKLFLVGDPKQSIYRFRRADLATYFDVRDRLVATGAERVELGSSFRAVPSIQRLVNAAFSPVMVEDRDSLSPGYVPLQSAGTPDPTERPSVVALPVPRPYGASGRLTLTAVRASQPQAVGAFVAWLLEESGFHVRDPASGERVPVAPRHVCLLFRYLDTRFRGDVGNAFAGALSARGIPVVLVGGKALFDREETLALVAAAGAIERPGDENDVYQTLRGPLFALTDDLLLDWRSRFRLDPRRPPITALPQHLEPVADVLALLAELHRARRRRTPVATLEHLLAAARAHVTLALRPSGEQALSNVAALLEVARREERRGALSFRAFVERLREEVERRRTPEPPLLEDESDAVRLMTVHKAKGLEFPVVILADPTPNGAPREVSRVVEPALRRLAFRVAGALPLDVVRGNDRELARERAESARLAYVAATRARDLLVVPIVGDSPVFPAEGWLAPLQRALVPPEGARPEASPGCPAFGRDSVMRRDEGEVAPEGSLTPGTYTSATGARFTVWDPAVLRLRPPLTKGLRRVDLVGSEGTLPEVVEEGRATLARFREARAACLLEAAIPTEIVVTATSSSHEEQDEDEDPADPPLLGAPPIDLEQVEREADRPRGPRFGDLVHQLLAVAPLDREADLQEEAHVRGRPLGLDAAAIAAAVRAAAAALRHPRLRAAAQAALRGECRREVPITHVLDETHVLEGVVDLAYRDEAGWVVVDFKTDAVLDVDRRAAYGRQVALYVAAIAAATGEPTRGLLLLV